LDPVIEIGTLGIYEENKFFGKVASSPITLLMRVESFFGKAATSPCSLHGAFPLYLIGQQK